MQEENNVKCIARQVHQVVLLRILAFFNKPIVH